MQTTTCHGSPVSGWRREPDTGPPRETVAIWILFNLFPVILLWSYSLFGPGMDVPEGSKHGKKSTSQKLEDQKKVGKLPCFLFFFTCSATKCSSFIFCRVWMCVLLFQKWSTLAFVGFQLYVCGNQGMKVCCSPGLFSSQKGEHVGPIAAVVWIPTCSFAPYLLIAIYKDVGGWGFLSPLSVSSLSSWLTWCGGGQGPPQPHWEYIFTLRLRCFFCSPHWE